MPYLLMVASAVGQVAVPAQEAAGAATYQPRAIASAGKDLQGKLIKLQFICRSSIVQPAMDGGVTGEVVDSPSTRITVDVQVPKAAVGWFMSIPTTYSGGPPFTIYARLSVDKFGAPVATLLGRTLRPIANGSSIEW
jgi:hypothetical protein